MTQTQAIRQDTQGNPLGRFIAFLYGLVAYLVFFVTFLYAIGFVSDLVVPKSINTGTVVPTIEAARLIAQHVHRAEGRSPAGARVSA